MTDRETVMYRRFLEDERMRLLRSIVVYYDQAREPIEPGNDFADEGTETCEKARCLGLAQSLEFASRARLEALPRTTLCIVCKAKLERNHRQSPKVTSLKTGHDPVLRPVSCTA